MEVFMRDNIVENYTWNILKKQLQKYKVTNNTLYEIINDVKIHLDSIIYHWNDIDFRNAILIIGSEEGNFYEPHDELIGCMVVVAIRNSLIEGIASHDYKKYGIDKILEDSDIKDITSTAIKYFSDVDLSSYAKKLNLEDDFYKNISNKYPIALNALKELAKCNVDDREHKYTKLSFKRVYELEELNSNVSVNYNTINIENGISPCFNDSLCEFLKGIRDGKSRIFLTDSFKMVTRNFEKLMRILEFILTHNGAFVTCNYLISNDYVSRRKELLRAGHKKNDFFEKFDKLNEISEHSDLLNNILELI